MGSWVLGWSQVLDLVSGSIVEYSLGYRVGSCVGFKLGSVLLSKYLLDYI